LDECVTHFNSVAFTKLLKKGHIPSYLLINKIIVGMREYRKLDRIIAAQELERMLLESVDVGVQLDLDQLNIISIMGKDVLDTVNHKYEQPYWKKVCKTPSHTIPEVLKRLAVSLNIDPTMNQSAICESINTLSKSDKESLKDAARKRQQMRMASDLGNMNEFLGDKQPTFACRNRSSMTHDPLDYNDMDIAYYRDEQGVIWCFTSDTFANLIETGVNPYNSVILPESFLAQLKYQLDVLRKLGIDAIHGEIGIYTSQIATTFSTALDELGKKDAITEKISSRALDKFIQLASIHSISPDSIKSLTKEKMIDGLRSINYNVELASLNTSHALVTVARIIDHLNKTDKGAVDVFFDSLNTFGKM